jgi:hypothetical protein
MSREWDSRSVSFARLKNYKVKSIVFSFLFIQRKFKEGVSAVQKVRSRLINFRVTDEELDQLKTAASVQGSRCLSEFARLVMLGTTTGAQFHAVPESLDGKLSLFNQRLNVLEANVARLVDALGERDGRRRQA